MRGDLSITHVHRRYEIFPFSRGPRRSLQRAFSSRADNLTPNSWSLSEPPLFVFHWCGVGNYTLWRTDQRSDQRHARGNPVLFQPINSKSGGCTLIPTPNGQSTRRTLKLASTTATNVKPYDLVDHFPHKASLEGASGKRRNELRFKFVTCAESQKVPGDGSNSNINGNQDPVRSTTYNYTRYNIDDLSPHSVGVSRISFLLFGFRGLVSQSCYDLTNITV